MVGELPEGWVEAKIGDIAACRMGKTILSKELTNEGIPVYSAGRDNEPWGYLPDPDVKFDAETVVISARGSIGHARIPKQNPFTCTQTTIAATCADPATASYLCHFLRTLDWNAYTEGNSIPMLTLSTLTPVEIPLPPLNEQRRIVARLEELTARTRAARGALEALPPLLDRFRQSVLAAAFRGDLTADWRARNPDVEPASELLKRIRVERRQRWEEAEIEKMRAKGKVPGDDRWKARYVEPEGVDAEGLPELPEGWAWATVGEVSEVEGGIQKQPSRRTGRDSFPFLRVANVFWGRLDLEDVHEIELFDGELERLRLHEGDLLVVEGNGSPTEVGRMAIWDGSIEDCVHQNHLIRVRALGGINPHFMSHFWSSPVGRQRVAREAQTTTGLYNLSKGKVSKLPVPLAPIAEQDALLAHLAPLLEFSRSVEGLSSSSLSRLTTLHQSLLAKAFRGELVPQDPNDEPASVLLERIRREREAAGGGGRPKRGRKAKQGSSRAGVPILAEESPARLAESEA